MKARVSPPDADAVAAVATEIAEPRQSYIATKIAPPKFSREQFARPNLIERLQEGKDGTLTYIRAPAGFGKSTLLTQWRAVIQEEGTLTAWYSIDGSDNEESQFVAYLVASLSKAGCPIGEGAFGIYRRGDPRSLENFIASIVNDISEFNQEIFLFIDDFHRISNPVIWGMVSSLLWYAPPNLHFVLASRAEVPFSLSQLRFHGQVLEIDVGELKFSFDEACKLLSEGLPLRPSANQMHAIYDATEGWVAALQLVVLSARRHKNVGLYLDSMLRTGDSTGIAEYLTHDWLKRMPPEAVDFLLKTSILDQFNADLSAAVTGLTDTERILRQLETENLFVIPLEGDGRWYRYHHLFAHYLQRQLIEMLTSDSRNGEIQGLSADIFASNSKTLPDPSQRATAGLSVLHARASAWFNVHGYIIESAQHALAAGDQLGALRVIEKCAMDLVASGELNTLLAWVERLPAEEVQMRARLRLARLWALILSCRLDLAKAELDALESNPSARALITEFEFDVLRAAIATYVFDSGKVGLLQRRWPFQNQHGDLWHTSAGCNVLAFHFIHEGDAPAAENVLNWAKLVDPSWESFYPGVYRNCFLGFISERRGDLSRAEVMYREAMYRAEQKGGRRSTPAIVAAGLLSAVLYETDRLAETESILANRFDYIGQGAYPGPVIAAYIAGSRERYLSGDAAGALELIAGLQAYGDSIKVPGVSVMANAEKLRRALWNGDLALAARLNNEIALLARDYEHIETGSHAVFRLAGAMSRLRLLSVKGCHAEVQDEARLWLARTEKCHSLTAQVSVMVLLALTLERSGQTTAAEQQILTALHKSEQAGLIRTFADEGGELYALIARAHGKNTDPALALSDAYLRRLKAGFGVELGNQQLSRLTHPESGDKLTEAFSQREREILGLLARGMPNKRIAHSLNVSVDTVKWHLKNLYSKLGTSSRFDAVQCARRHGLIAD